MGDYLQMVKHDEPVDLKKDIQDLISRMRDETWDYQSLGVWAANKIPQYLWTELDWKSSLKEDGWTWQRFLKMMSRHTNDLIRWVSDKMTWDDVIKILWDDMQNPILRSMYFYGK